MDHRLVSATRISTKNVEIDVTRLINQASKLIMDNHRRQIKSIMESEIENREKIRKLIKLSVIRWPNNIQRISNEVFKKSSGTKLINSDCIVNSSHNTEIITNNSKNKSLLDELKTSEKNYEGRSVQTSILSHKNENHSNLFPYEIDIKTSEDENDFQNIDIFIIFTGDSEKLPVTIFLRQYFVSSSIGDVPFQPCSLDKFRFVLADHLSLIKNVVIGLKTSSEDISWSFDNLCIRDCSLMKEYHFPSHRLFGTSTGDRFTEVKLECSNSIIKGENIFCDNLSNLQSYSAIKQSKNNGTPLSNDTEHLDQFMNDSLIMNNPAGNNSNEVRNKNEESNPLLGPTELYSEKEINTKCAYYLENSNLTEGIISTEKECQSFLGSETKININMRSQKCPSELNPVSKMIHKDSILSRDIGVVNKNKKLNSVVDSGNDFISYSSTSDSDSSDSTSESSSTTTQTSSSSESTISDQLLPKKMTSEIKNRILIPKVGFSLNHFRNNSSSTTGLLKTNKDDNVNNKDTEKKPIPWLLKKPLLKLSRKESNRLIKLMVLDTLFHK